MDMINLGLEILRFFGEGFLNPEKLDFTSWWVSIWNLSSIHQDTEGAGKEPKAKQVKLWLWPEKRGTLATVAPNSTDNGRTEKVQHLESIFKILLQILTI